MPGLVNCMVENVLPAVRDRGGTRRARSRWRL